MNKVISKKTHRLLNKKNLSICLISSCLILFIIFCLVFHLFNKKVFSVESRIEEVSNFELLDDSSDFETIGWLRIQGTSIDYPIIYTSKDVDSFPVEIENFVWSVNSDTHFHNQINIIGHNIFNLSSQPLMHSEEFHRFEELMDFVYYDFAKENQHIQLTIDGEDYVYKVFAVEFVRTADIVDIGMNLPDDYINAHLQEHIDYLNTNSMYDYDIDVNNQDSIIILNTCTRFFGTDPQYDFIVAGRLVRDGESYANVRISKNDSYQDIENILKGDDENENS